MPSTRRLLFFPFAVQLMGECDPYKAQRYVSTHQQSPQPPINAIKAAHQCFSVGATHGNAIHPPSQHLTKRQQLEPKI